MIEALRNKLHQFIDLYGRQDERTLKVSQELNELIVVEQIIAIKRTLCKGSN